MGRSGAWVSSLVTDIVLTQPVVYEFERLEVPTLLVVGERDTTAIGKQWAPPDVQAVVGNDSVQGKEAAARIEGSTYIRFAALGHAPHISHPDEVNDALLNWLER